MLPACRDLLWAEPAPQAHRLPELCRPRALVPLRALRAAARWPCSPASAYSTVTCLRAFTGASPKDTTCEQTQLCGTQTQFQHKAGTETNHGVLFKFEF